MTKAEQAAMQDLRVRAALGWPQYEKPSPMQLQPDMRKLVVGWHMNAYTGEVGQGCTNGYNHCRHSTTKTSTQGAGRFWDTELEALQALRWEMSERFASDLQKIDARIAKAQSNV